MTEVEQAEESQEACFGKPVLMTLREALEEAPAAVTEDLVSYVCYNEDGDSEHNRPWSYTPDTRGPRWEEWQLQDDQLERLVLFSQLKRWLPTSPIIWT